MGNPRQTRGIFDSLSPRARHCLEREGFETREQVAEAIRIGWLHPRRQPKYGRATHSEVCRWAGVSDPPIWTNVLLSNPAAGMR